MRVITLTANLLAETTYTFDGWKEGATQRAGEEFFQVGGKGINVTRMLARMGIDSEALWFPGGATGKRCASWLEQAGIPHRPFPTAAETRTGAVVRAPGRSETTFLGAENDVGAEAIAACADYLAALPNGSVVSISGSIPFWDDARWDSFRGAIAERLERGRVFVDSYGPPLAWFAERPAALVKINRKEFAGLVGETPKEMTEARMPELLRRVASTSRPRAWVVTDGPNPVWCAAHDIDPVSVSPPRVEEISPTGSGDVFMAALIYALEERRIDLGSAVKFALPIAAANAASPGVADFDLRPFGFAV